MVRPCGARPARAPHSCARSETGSPELAGPSASMARMAAQVHSLVAGAGRMSRPPRPFRHRAIADVALPEELPPLLRRIYAARQVTAAAQLATGMDSMLPVSSLEGVQAAA